MRAWTLRQPTLATFACSVVDIQDFDKSLDEMVPGQHLTLLERSQLRAAFKLTSHRLWDEMYDHIA